MKTNFDWQTEESSEPQKDGLSDIVPPARSKLGCLTIGLVVAVIAISSAAWLVNQRQSKAIANVSEDVLSAFELQQQAAENEDTELFSALLSESDPVWKRDQEKLLGASLFNDRGRIGLDGNSESRTQGTLDLSPDLHKAEVSYIQTYTAVTDSTESSDIELLHTLIYRLEDGRWMNAPSDLSFWGPWKEVHGKLISITVPERDTELASRLVNQIDAYLKGVCSEVNEGNDYGLVYCEGYSPWRIKLSTEVETLLNLHETPSGKSSEFDYELPAPTLIGIPLNQVDYETYFEIYTKVLLQKMEMALLATVPSPGQNIYALCFVHPLNGRHLYRYDWQLRSWKPFFPSQTFQHLSALPDDSAIMLADNDSLTVMVGNRDADSTGHMKVWQGKFPLSDSQYLIGWVATGNTPYHLLQHGASDGQPPGYSALDLRDCESLSCDLTDLPGFPIPSTTSSASLYSNGSEIVVADGAGELPQFIGMGFSPFWVDDKTFGFVRFAGDSNTAITTQVVLGGSNRDLQVLFDGADLTRAADILWENVLFVNGVIPNPADSGLLLVSSTGIRDYSGSYFIFSADISNRLDQSAPPELKLELARHGTQGGVPGLLSPTGPPAFLVSSDGRWLAMTELNSEDSESWTILVHDLKTGITSEVSDNVPAMPGNFPQLDWSSDGQWLLVADRNHLQLFAPDYGYEELIAHDFDACSHVVWAE